MALERERTAEDPEHLALQLATLLRQYPGEIPRVRNILDAPLNPDQTGERTPPQPLPVPEVKGDFPNPLIRAKNQRGMILAEGHIAILAAEGGIGKSSLTGTIALETAMTQDAPFSGIFDIAHGPVLMATYEDPAPVSKWKLTELARRVDQERGGSAAQDALNSIYLLDLEGWPLYGPPEQLSYATRPGPLQGWQILWQAVAQIQPKLLIIDPALKSYVGEPNNPAPVREFLGHLRQQLNTVSNNGAGILLTAHSTKAARGSRSAARQDPFDPGQTSGSAAWTDEPRGVMTMTWSEEAQNRVLSVVKANLGPSRISVQIAPAEHQNGGILGFTAQGPWHSPNTAPENTTPEKIAVPNESTSLWSFYDGIAE